MRSTPDVIFLPGEVREILLFVVTCSIEMSGERADRREIVRLDEAGRGNESRIVRSAEDNGHDVILECGEEFFRYKIRQASSSHG